MSEGNFQRILAIHAAPTLLGIKCANLISVPATGKEIAVLRKKFQTETQGSGLRMRVLCGCRERILVYIYHEQLLSLQLGSPEVQAFLQDYGYAEDMTVPEMLTTLGKRISCESFPHEIGVFLGYPLADVEGFIRNAGQNCLLCGCWKVYSEPERAKQLFNAYGRCREYLCDKLEQGIDLYQALQFQEVFS
jgi:hypothetical protein